ncbi:phage tail protein [Methanoregula formicica]|uniref:T4-like virus tail tube protein gp19 n=1 Tax=Methanoregula formicica (strain DSM 22288 / NBRC 105244 / SMSP) TaxID=593750 RepID=L0HCW8_METFS|nr:phage tail protein [Methanoregula formicica]AGB02577.1 T4-like virus tail tube protein gp19 [Methanoregula formicica SMSP]
MSLEDDLCRKFRFRVKWNGRYVAGFPEASPLPVDMRRAGQRQSGGPPPAIGPEGQCTPYFINLDRSIAVDLGFAQWIAMVRSFGPATGKGSLLPEYKRPFTIEACDENGDVEYSYYLSNCWVDEYRAFPDPDAGSREVAIEHLRLGYDDWSREPLEGK